MVEYLPSVCAVLDSIPSTIKKKHVCVLKVILDSKRKPQPRNNGFIVSVSLNRSQLWNSSIVSLCVRYNNFFYPRGKIVKKLKNVIQRPDLSGECLKMEIR